MPVTVIATLEARDGQQDAVVEAVGGVADRIHAESGCLKCTLHRSGRNRLILVESWQDQQSLEEHSRSDAYTDLSPRLAKLLSQPPEIKLASPFRSAEESKGRFGPTSNGLRRKTGVPVGTPVIRDEGHVRWVHLDRPETLNALQVEDLPALGAAVSTRPRDIRAVVLTGGQRAFSSGMHKDAFAGATPYRARDIISQVAACLDAVRRADVPTVAMVDGYCLGAAFEMILGCDFRVVSTRSVFGLPEVRLGIPSVIDAALLRHHVGLGLAKEIVLTGDFYKATELKSCRLFNRVVDPSALHGEVVDLLGRVSGLTREVVAAQKGLFETWMNQGLQDGIDTSIDVFGRLFESPETLDAIARYGQKR